ncbi:hypothetical protein [Streptomyces sp.]|uniref:hypothetical protein n=1 Tax=Streptomyces sp. TaxID=1931 RepID=UPI002F91E9D1
MPTSDTTESEGSATEDSTPDTSATETTGSDAMDAPKTEASETEASETEASETDAAATAASDAADESDASDASDETDASEKAALRSDRRAVAAVVGALLLVTGGLVGYGLLDSADKPAERAVPTADVTYEVLGSGTADISFLGEGETARAGKAEVAQGATLPWRKTVRVPLGKQPIVSITLGAKGGQATCKLAVGGKHVQLSSATGAFGRATCSSELAAPQGAVTTPGGEY